MNNYFEGYEEVPVTYEQGYADAKVEIVRKLRERDNPPEELRRLNQDSFTINVLDKVANFIEKLGCQS